VIVKFPSNLSVERDENAQFEVTVTGRPEPHVEWCVYRNSDHRSTALEFLVDHRVAVNGVS